MCGVLLSVSEGRWGVGALGRWGVGAVDLLRIGGRFVTDSAQNNLDSKFIEDSTHQRGCIIISSSLPYILCPSYCSGNAKASQHPTVSLHVLFVIVVCHCCRSLLFVIVVCHSCLS